MKKKILSVYWIISFVFFLVSGIEFMLTGNKIAISIATFFVGFYFVISMVVEDNRFVGESEKK
jgi:hypothetical protein